jgi:hypothetical protein
MSEAFVHIYTIARLRFCVSCNTACNSNNSFFCAVRISAAEAATARATDFTPKELLALISAFADMARWYYDAQLLDKLAEAVAAAAEHFDAEQLAAVQSALTGIKHKLKV